MTDEDLAYFRDHPDEIGAAVTAYLLGMLLNRQQENAVAWRTDIRQRLEQGEP